MAFFTDFVACRPCCQMKKAPKTRGKMDVENASLVYSDATFTWCQCSGVSV